MADPTLQDKVTALLSRSSAGNSKSNSVVDSAVTFESILIKMLLYPRVVPYFGFMAANGLNAAITTELGLCDKLIQAIKDLGNQSKNIDDTSDLSAASAALSQLGGTTFDTTSPGLQQFNKGVDNFLNGSIRDNVIGTDNTLRRPASEAEPVITSLYSQLAEAHAEVLVRMSALSVGVDNFARIPFTSVIGQSVVARVRASIDAVIQGFTTDPTAAGARDAVLALLAGKASLRMIGSIPDPFAPVVDTVKGYPPGYLIHAKTAFAAPSVTTLAGPTIPTSASLTIGGSGGSYTKSSFPLDGVGMGSRACLYGTVVGSSVVFPSSPGANLYLFFTNGTTKTYKRINFTGTMTMAAILAAINAAFSTGTSGVAVEFVEAGSGRIAIVPTAGYSVTVVPMDDASAGGWVAPTAGTKSATGFLGFQMGQSARTGPVSGAFLFDVFRYITLHHLPAVQVSMVDSTKVKLYLATGTPGTFLSMSGTATTSLFGQATITTNGMTDQVILYGAAAGAVVDPINPLLVVQKNDTIKLGSTTSTIKDVSSTALTLTAPVKSYSGNVTVTATTGTLWRTLSSQLRSSVGAVLSSIFAKNLNKLRFAISGLSAASSPAKLSDTVTTVTDLKNVLSPVATALTTTPLPASTGGTERAAAREIINSLQEKKYDRALDFLLRAQFDKLMGLTSETASYGGSLMRATADVGTLDSVVVDPTKTEAHDKSGAEVQSKYKQRGEL